jgi:hypothetical protein
VIRVLVADDMRILRDTLVAVLNLARASGALRIAGKNGILR